MDIEKIKNEMMMDSQFDTYYQCGVRFFNLRLIAIAIITITSIPLYELTRWAVFPVMATGLIVGLLFGLVGAARVENIIEESFKKDEFVLSKKSENMGALIYISLGTVNLFILLCAFAIVEDVLFAFMTILLAFSLFVIVGYLSFYRDIMGSPSEQERKEKYIINKLSYLEAMASLEGTGWHVGHPILNEYIDDEIKEDIMYELINNEEMKNYIDVPTFSSPFFVLIFMAIFLTLGPVFNFNVIAWLFMSGFLSMGAAGASLSVKLNEIARNSVENKSFNNNVSSKISIILYPTLWAIISIIITVEYKVFDSSDWLDLYWVLVILTAMFISCLLHSLIKNELTHRDYVHFSMTIDSIFNRVLKQKRKELAIKYAETITLNYDEQRKGAIIMTTKRRNEGKSNLANYEDRNSVSTRSKGAGVLTGIDLGALDLLKTYKAKKIELSQDTESYLMIISEMIEIMKESPNDDVIKNAKATLERALSELERSLNENAYVSKQLDSISDANALMDKLSRKDD